MFEWKEKKVLVTGGTGFIGSWLTEHLLHRGASVTVLVRKDDPLGLGGIRSVTGKLKIMYSDIRDKNGVHKAVTGQEIIFHLAAITQVLYSIKNPQETFDVNVSGTLNLLESARKCDTEFFVFASTDKVYGEPKYLPIDESHPLSAKSPYDASKIAADQMVSAYTITYGLPSSRVRWSNTIGGRDSNILRVVPDFITSILYNEKLSIRGDGKHIRDYMYVTDAIEGMISLVENRNVSNGEAFNLGTERPTSVLELAKLIIKLMGIEEKVHPTILSRNVRGEIKKQYLSAKKAQEKLKWFPKVHLEDGLRKTVQWYKQNPSWYDLMQKVAQHYGL